MDHIAPQEQFRRYVGAQPTRPIKRQSLGNTSFKATHVQHLRGTEACPGRRGEVAAGGESERARAVITFAEAARDSVNTILHALWVDAVLDFCYSLICWRVRSS